MANTIYSTSAVMGCQPDYLTKIFFYKVNLEKRIPQNYILRKISTTDSDASVRDFLDEADLLEEMIDIHEDNAEYFSDQNQVIAKGRLTEEDSAISCDVFSLTHIPNCCYILSSKGACRLLGIPFCAVSIAVLAARYKVYDKKTPLSTSHLFVDLLYAACICP